MTRLGAHLVEKPWGRTELPPMFDATGGERIGEVWFDAPGDAPLLVKYIFTSERLSIQVHPDDAQAKARGLPNGKTECWYILDAEADATIGIGLKRAVSGEALRAAALDGSIEQLIDWRPVKAGDFIFVPAGTIHAIGGGISLLEMQQNSDVTFRLYDYGRPRELHLDEAIAVARPEPYPADGIRNVADVRCGVLVQGPHFTLTVSNEDAQTDRLRWVIPIEGEVRSGADRAGPGDCLLLRPGERFEPGDARVLIAAST